MMKDAGVIVECGKNSHLHRSARGFFILLLVLIAAGYKSMLPEKNRISHTHVRQDIANSELSSSTVNATVLTEGLSFPWEILWGPDDHIWMTERGGRISRVNPQTGNVTPILRVPDVKS